VFSAGAIEASLTVDPSQFNRELDKAEARVKEFERLKHEVRLSAVFDTSSMARARQMFAQLDQQISKDAMSRLRSSPQGSVLGSLNALFSPHQVTGAPSAQQAAQQGLLGKMISSQGGGIGNTNGTNSTSRAPSPNTPAQAIRQVLTGQAPGNTTTTDTIRQNLTGQGARDVTTTDTIRQQLSGQGARDTTTTDTVKEKLDAASAAKTEADATSSGDRAGKGWASSFTSRLTGLFGGIFGNGGGGGGGNGGQSAASASGGSFGAKLVDAIGPGILGTSFKTASIAGLGGAALGGLPALVAGLAPLGLAGAGAGILTAGASSLIGQKNTKTNPNAQGPLYDQAQAAGKALQDSIQKAASGLIVPLKNLFAQIPALAKQITPALTQVFSGTAALIQPVVTGLVSAVKQIGPGLSAAFRATGPLLQPLITGLGALVGGLLPGLVSLLKAAGPAVQVVSGFFGALGTNLGAMFRDFSTVIGPSSVILKALLDVITGLLPVIGGLAQVMAQALGPAFTAFAGAIKALEPFLVGIGKIIAQFAGAVLQDLSAGLQLVAGVLKAVAPAFNTLATTLGQVFNTLESKGAFAQLGNILEGLAAPLGTLISKLIDGLAPAIPPLLTLFSQLVNVVSSVGVHVLTALIPPLTQLAETALGAILKVLPLVLPVLTQFLAAFTTDAGNLIASIGGSLLNLANVVLTALLKAAAPLIPVVLGLVSALIPLLNVFTAATAAAISAVANALAAVVNAIPSGVLTAVIAGVAGVVGGMKLWGLATAGVATAIKAVTGSSIVSWLAGAIGSVTTFAAATEGATLAEKGMLAAELAFDAVSPFVWVGAAAAGLVALTVALVRTSAQSQTIVGEFQQQAQALDYNISGYQKLAAQAIASGQSITASAQRYTDAVRGGYAGLVNLGSGVKAVGDQISQTGITLLQRVTVLSQGIGVSKTTIEQWAQAAGISAGKFAGAGENVGQLTTQIVGFVNKNAAAVTATSSLSTNVAIFGSDVFNATTQLDAFNAIWNTLVGNLLTKQMAVTQSDAQFQNLSQTIKQNGANSTAAAQSFQSYIGQIGATATALDKSGASVSTINSYLQAQINHIQNLGPLNKGEQADLAGLKAAQDAYANSTHGLTDNQLTWIQQVEGHLIPDLAKMHANTPLVNADINNLANAIAQTGTQSAVTASDRAQLIGDIAKITGNTKTATSYVDGLIKKLGQVPKSVGTQVTVSASAKGAITAALGGTNTSSISNIEALLQFGAAGMLVSGGTPGKDSVLAALMPGEVVVPVPMVNAGAVDHLRGSIPGFAAGGQVNLAGPYKFVNTDSSNFVTDMGTVFANEAIAAFQASLKKAAVAAAGPGGGAPSANAALAKKLYPAYASGPVWNAWNAVAMAESGWNQFATNPSSGAYGIPQALPYTKMPKAAWPASAGGSSNPTAQIEWMWNYMASTYGGPIGAAQHEAAYHWYGNGGPINEPVLGYGMRSGDRYMLGERGSEMVTPIGGAQGGGATVADLAAKLDQLNASTKRLIDVSKQAPAATGQHVGAAINGAAHSASFSARYPHQGW
jgi:phage-related protein